MFGVWSVFPALGSEKLWQFLEAPETKQNNYSFVFFFHVLWFNFHCGIVEANEFDGALNYG